ncbi:two-component system, sporulation sensor kinase E [Oikeobacillus pervagus]|uniref:histidine kinase n=1 Tax=Oikeobacillus pervagus TaxID=1325931 RepID=A0AAJ1WIW9_9BACI|nr:PAS domain-containing sensor histidine kinase [Oikeobacillus pervagus]MDQ0214848.1 two-component system, sporulation sensor kinase E [Oikeobacillus pervagus]
MFRSCQCTCGSAVFHDDQGKLVQLLPKIIEGSSEAIVVKDFQSNIVLANKAAETFTLYNEEELNSMKWNDLFPSIQAATFDCLEVRPHFKGEMFMKLKDRSCKYVHLTIHREVEMKLDICYINEVVEKKEISENQLFATFNIKDIFQHITDGVILFDQDGMILYVNPAFSNIVNMDIKEIESSPIQSLIPNEFHHEFKRFAKLFRKGGRLCGEIPIAQNDSYIVAEFTLSRNVQDGINMVILKDITLQRQMKMNLEKSEKMFEALFNEAIDGIVFWDKDGHAIKANDSALKIFECTMEELINKKISDFILNKQDQKFIDTTHKLNENGEVREDLHFLMPNGQKKHLEFTIKLHSEDGYSISIFRNISERYEIERQLRKSEKRFRKVFKGTVDGMILWNQNYKIVDVNPSVCKILKWTREQLIGRDIRVFERISHNEEVMMHWKKTAEEGKGNSIVSVKRNDRNYYFEVSTKMHINSQLHLTIIRDLTEEIEIQEKLKKSDTLNIVGELAAGIAHEIRNPMTALKGFIQLLESDLEDEYGMYFNVITTELSRIESIITEFLILAKPQAIQYKKANITKILQETIELLNAQATMHNVLLKLKAEVDLPEIYAEGNQLKQVFINIIKNAIEAMPKGGHIYVKVNQKDQKYISISIIDEGIGMSDEKLNRLGEPFYTTKDRGTGLGLMVSFKIIKEHNGIVNVESEVGKGTAFHILLPQHLS